MTGDVTIYTKYVAPSRPGGRGLAVQVIELVDSYMIWVGGAEGGPEEVGRAMEKGRLCRDWGCGVGGAGTRLAGGGDGDGVGVASRLALRLGKVVYVSMDVSGGEVGDAERGVVEAVG
jgi:proteasome assembly chaperone 4